MKLNELKKLYKYNKEKDSFTIDVQLEDYRDAYSDWDFSPFVNRDLDEDLTEYLLECSYEIPLKYNLTIDFHILNQEYNIAREEKSILGMHNYFKYQLRKLKNYYLRIVREIVTYLVIGSILLLAGFYFDSFFSESLLLSVVSEGLFIGGWVMLWEMFSAWLFDIQKAKNKFKHFERLNQSTIIYSYLEGA
jgi:hypothetical protein